MSYIKEMKDYFSRFVPGNPGTLEGIKTHMMEIWSLMRHGLDDLALTEDLHYEGDALKVKIKFADKKLYEIRIKEVK